MPPRNPQKMHTSEKSPGKKTPNDAQRSGKGKPTDYTSHGVTDNDIFLLPGSDLQLLALLTAIGAVVRLFRIYQPASVVFDEVQ